MTALEFKSLKKGDVIFVRDFGSPSLIRKALFEEDITSKRDVHPGLCTYLESDGSISMQSVVDKQEPTVCYFSLNESALTEDELRSMLLKDFNQKAARALDDLKKYNELALKLERSKT